MTDLGLGLSPNALLIDGPHRLCCAAPPVSRVSPEPGWGQPSSEGRRGNATRKESRRGRGAKAQFLNLLHAGAPPTQEADLAYSFRCSSLGRDPGRGN